MSESARNFLVGIFVLTALSVLAVLMVWFGEAPSWLGGGEWSLRIVGVTGLSGINEGSPVSLNGVEIGRVKQLEFENPSRPDQGVVIVAGIKRGYLVPRGAFAKVYGATLGIGTGRIEIVVEKGGAVEPLPFESAVIHGEMRSVIGELISKDLVRSVQRTITEIGDLAAAATPVAEHLAEFLESRPVFDVDRAAEEGARLQANLTTVVERLDRLVTNVNAVLGDEHVQDDVRAAVRDLRQTTSSLKETVELWKHETKRLSDNINRRVDRTGDQLDAAFRDLHDVLANLDEASSSLARVLNRVDRGEGTMGLLARDERLYESGVLALDRLAELAATLQRILGQAERDGYLKVGKATPVGPMIIDVPTGKVVASLVEKLARREDEPMGPPLDAASEPADSGRPAP